MAVEVDQSGKVEETAKSTVLAFSNGTRGSLLFSSKDKRIVQQIYRSLGKPRMFTIQVFSALVYLLMEKYNLFGKTVELDEEYKGQDLLIKSYLTQLANKRCCKKAVCVNFRRIGKRSNAHKCAIKAFRDKKAEISVKLEEIIILVFLYDK